MTARAKVVEAPHTLRPREFALPDADQHGRPRSGRLDRRVEPGQGGRPGGRLRPGPRPPVAGKVPPARPPGAERVELRVEGGRVVTEAVGEHHGRAAPADLEVHARRVR